MTEFMEAAQRFDEACQQYQKAADRASYLKKAAVRLSVEATTNIRMYIVQNTEIEARHALEAASVYHVRATELFDAVLAAKEIALPPLPEGK